jgi:hypothetical protein
LPASILPLLNEPNRPAAIEASSSPVDAAAAGPSNLAPVHENEDEDDIIATPSQQQQREGTGFGATNAAAGAADRGAASAAAGTNNYGANETRTAGYGATGDYGANETAGARDDNTKASGYSDAAAGATGYGTSAAVGGASGYSQDRGLLNDPGTPITPAPQRTFLHQEEFNNQPFDQRPIDERQALPHVQSDQVPNDDQWRDPDIDGFESASHHSKTADHFDSTHDSANPIKVAGRDTYVPLTNPALQQHKGETTAL